MSGSQLLAKCWSGSRPTALLLVITVIVCIKVADVRARRETVKRSYTRPVWLLFHRWFAHPFWPWEGPITPPGSATVRRPKGPKFEQSEQCVYYSIQYTRQIWFRLGISPWRPMDVTAPAGQGQVILKSKVPPWRCPLGAVAFTILQGSYPLNSARESRTN